MKNKLNKPLISIITVVYNAKEVIEDTILSILKQDIENLEYIIIDGGSSDGTIEIINKYCDDIDFFVSEKDEGIYDAMNKGISMANGQWINFINAGDKLLFLDIKSLNSLDTTHSCYFYNEEKEKIEINPFTKFYLTHNTPCHQSIFYRKNELLEYNLQFPIIADFEQMTRICKKNYSAVYGNHIVYFAKAGISFENSNNKSWTSLFEKLKIIKKNMGISYFILGFFHTLRIKLL